MYRCIYISYICVSADNASSQQTCKPRSTSTRASRSCTLSPLWIFLLLYAGAGTPKKMRVMHFSPQGWAGAQITVSLAQKWRCRVQSVKRGGLRVGRLPSPKAPDHSLLTSSQHVRHHAVFHLPANATHILVRHRGVC